MTDTKLTSILAEVKRELKSHQKKAIKETQRQTMSQLTLEKILNSGALLAEETSILREFIEYRGNSVVLNENTIKMVDKEFLNEGVIDWIKKKGKAALDFLKSGWASVKKVWNNFKDFVAGIIQKVKETFNKIWEWVKSKASSAIDWIKGIGKALPKVAEKLPDEIKKAIPGDIQNLKACVVHFKTYVTKMISGDEWEGKVASGDLKVKDSANENLFEDRNIILTLKEDVISEGGFHPVDLLKKYPILHKIVKYVIEGLLWIFNFPVKLVQTVIKMGSENIFKRLGWLSSKTGGPGPFVFAAIATILAESAEILGHNLGAVHHFLEVAKNWTVSLISSSLSWMGPVGSAFGIICDVVMTFGYYYAIATVVLNYGKLIVDGVIDTPVAKAVRGAIDTTKDLAKQTTTVQEEFDRMQRLAGIKL